MTIQELFEQMTSIEIALFTKNVVEKRGDIKGFFEDEYPDMQSWISSAFIWSETEEGHMYWGSVAARQPINEASV